MTGPGVLPAGIQDILASAVLAPSSHNSQPWTFSVRGDRIDLLADRSRALPVNDTDDRELIISCGCALFNMRVAIAEKAGRAAVRILPDANNPDLLASIELGAGEHESGIAHLYHWIPYRRTYRRRFREHTVAGSIIDRLGTACAMEHAKLTFMLSEERRQHLAALVAEADRLQWADPRWRRELAAWMHAKRRGDGLPVGAITEPFTQLVVRSFDMGNGIAAKDRELADGSPVLGVIATKDESPRQWLAAGQALQHAWLEACAAGLQLSFLNQAVEVPAVRAQLQELAVGIPQLVVRLGYADVRLEPTARRRLEDVVTAA